MSSNKVLLEKIEIPGIDELRKTLQQAVALEHSTIPPYLTALYTLYGDVLDMDSNNPPVPVPNPNIEIIKIINSVVQEEMLHMSIACNVLNAVGGAPAINTPDFIPKYPGHLPGGVEGSLVVNLEKFSIDLVQNTFMVIEEPENPINIKLLADDKTVTIGQFYTNIINSMTILEEQAKAQGKTIFTGNPNRQMTNENWYPESELFAVTELESAVKAINIIIDQGEGTSNDPFVALSDDSGKTELAHYYRFQQIVKGHFIKLDPTAPSGYSYTGAPITFNEKIVSNMKPNPSIAACPVNTEAYTNTRLFNYTYGNLLNCLHETFNGQPQSINAAIGLMFSLRLYAINLLQIPLNTASSDNTNPLMYGPSFEYAATDSMPNA